MEVLITGAAGFFGRSLVRQFAMEGETVVAADILADGDFEPRPDTPQDSLTYLQLDVADQEAWSTPELEGIEGIVHAAALTPSLEETKHNPNSLLRVNLLGTLNALEFARVNMLSKFLFISSGGVYDQFQPVVLREEDADGGFSLYGSAKLAAEILVFRYSTMFGFDAGAVRPTSMYGPAEELRDTRPFVTEIKLLADAAREGRATRIEHLDSHCDWVYVDDVAEASYRFFASQMGGQALNLSSGNPRAFSEVVRSARDAFGFQTDESAETVIDGGPDRPTVISPDKAGSIISWDPAPVEEGMKRYADALGIKPSSKSGS